jgi:NAD-dependent dihydropyrimidine dehydrogenase PreA subunit
MAKAAPAYDSTRVVALPCLGRVDETVLVGLAAHGAASVTLVCANCASCERAPGGALVRQVVESAKNLLEAFSSSLCVELASRLPARVAGEKSDADQPNDPSRRDFFRSFKDGTLGVAASAAGLAEDERVSTDARASATAPSLPSRLKVGANGTLPQFIPERRTRVFGYLEHLGAPVAEAVECRIAGAVTIEAQRCEACRMCAVFCPTGALARADEDGRWGLVHRPSACVGCRLCEKVCPRKALSVGARVPMRQFLGEKAVWFKLKPPAWTPNKPDSMFTKMRLVLGDNTEMCMF